MNIDSAIACVKKFKPTANIKQSDALAARFVMQAHGEGLRVLLEEAEFSPSTIFLDAFKLTDQFKDLPTKLEIWTQSDGQIYAARYVNRYTERVVAITGTSLPWCITQACIREAQFWLEYEKQNEEENETETEDA